MCSCIFMLGFLFLRDSHQTSQVEMIVISNGCISNGIPWRIPSQPERSGDQTSWNGYAWLFIMKLCKTLEISAWTADPEHPELLVICCCCRHSQIAERPHSVPQHRFFFQDFAIGNLLESITFIIFYVINLFCLWFYLFIHQMKRNNVEKGSYLWNPTLIKTPQNINFFPYIVPLSPLSSFYLGIEDL